MLKDGLEDHPNTTAEHWGVYQRAMAEVEAIEKAAGEIYAKGDDADPYAWALMDEIWHDSPKS